MRINCGGAPWPTTTAGSRCHSQAEARTATTRLAILRSTRAIEARRGLRIAKRGVAVRPSGWRWRHILAAAAGHGPSGEVDPWGGGWRRKERGGTERGGGEGRGGDGRGRATHPDEPCQCLHALTGGGRRGAWHQLGLLMGSCSWVASPQICVTGEEMLLAGTTRTTTAQRQTWCRVESSGARWAVAAGQLRAGCARLDARKVLGRAGLHLVRSAAGALPQAERRAPFERRSSMAPM